MQAIFKLLVTWVMFAALWMFPIGLLGLWLGHEHLNNHLGFVVGLAGFIHAITVIGKEDHDN